MAARETWGAICLMNLAERDPEGQARIAAFREGLGRLGWTEGREVQIEYRWFAGDPERAQAYAADLVKLKPEVIFARVRHPHWRRCCGKRAACPSYLAQVADPVGGGFVASLARPGGNITGFAQFEYAIGARWLELLTTHRSAVSARAAAHAPREARMTLGLSLTSSSARAGNRSA